MKTLLEKYCAAFAPSGQEDELREMIASDVAPYADELRTDRSGSLIAFKKGRKRRAEKLLFSAHMDEVAAAYPNFKVIATTLREVCSATVNNWSAMAWYFVSALFSSRRILA